MNPIWEIVPYTRGKGLEVNSESRAYPHFMRADPDCIKQQSLDFVLARNVTELDQQWWKVVKYGGFLVVIGEDVADCLDHYDCLRHEKSEEGIFQVYKRRQNGGHNHVPERIPEKSCAVVRLGAYGDAIQASSILPHLKERGFHITFYCNPSGYEVLKHDPHIDRFYVQDTDQIPNGLLWDFWEHERVKYQKWVNLSESVEGSLLATDGSARFQWPKELRHRVMNENYLEFTHEIAGSPFQPKARFYPSQEERAWARKLKEKSGPSIVWSLSGSAIHKVWPHMDAIIARVLMESRITKIVLVGGPSDAPLQGPWEKEERVWKKAGEWSIRQAMAFAQEADLVIGSETGLLNAVGLDSVPKIVCMSHSSPENLCKHWRNTTVLMPPESVSCYPCHRLITKWEHCNRDEQTGVALCQAKIDVDTMWLAIQDVFRKAA